MKIIIKFGFKSCETSRIYKIEIIPQGLLKVGDDQISLLASEIDGIPIRFGQLNPFYVFAPVTHIQPFERTLFLLNITEGRGGVL
jgi:hypothetical protein